LAAPPPPLPPSEAEERLDLSVLAECIPVVKELMMDYMEYTRIPFLLTLQNVFVDEMPKNLTGDELMRLYNLIKNDPLELCYKNPLAPKPIAFATYEQIHLENKKRTHYYTGPELMAAYCYSHFRFIIKEQRGWSAIAESEFRQGVEKSPQGKFYEKAMKHLLEERKALVLQDGFLMYPKTVSQMEVAVQRLKMLSAFGGERCELRRELPRVPCLLNRLTDEQTKAALHMLNEPLTIVVGPPGRGKTSLVEFGVAYWDKVCVVSFVGKNVSCHRSRINGRQEVSNTAHHVYHAEKFTDSGRTWVQQFHQLIWDEFSNVHENLFVNVLRALRNLRRLVLILDPAQIQPIGAGSPGMDLIECFPEVVMELTVNLRADPRARAMAESSVKILRGRPQDIEWSHRLEDLESMTMLNGSITLDDRMVLRQQLRRVVTHCIKHRAVYGVNSVMDIQFITFERQMRDAINEEAEQVFRETELLSYHPGKPQETIRRGLQIYVGVKLCFRENFKSLTVPPPVISMPSQEYDEIRNGECGTVLSFTKKDNNYLVITIQMPNVVKRILLDRKRHVSPSAVHLGHCITSNISQGDEFNTVIGVMHDSAAWVTRSHLYVMSSRGKKAYISMTNVKDGEALFNTICQRLDQKRVTALRQALLHNLFNFAPNPLPHYTELLDNTKLVLNEDKSVPCVPVQEVKEVAPRRDFFKFK
jgi:hypothetical protein